MRRYVQLLARKYLGDQITRKIPLRRQIFPLYSRLTAQARESFITRPERVFCRPDHKLGRRVAREKCPRLIS